MTTSPDAPRLRFDSLDEAVDALRARGLRLSTARRLILQALFTAEGPVSAVHLARMLSIDESSVYRNLEVLEGHGVVRHVHLGHGPGLYVLLGSDEAEYLYCQRCAKVTIVAPEQLDGARAEIARAVGYETRFTHFAIVGLCETCAALSDETAVHDHDSPPAGVPRDAHSHGDFVHSHSQARAEPHAHRH
jgi:Fur family ferric uptake transcriptional regulator